MENKGKSKGLIVLVIVLSIIVLGLSGFIVYDKVLNKPEKVVEEKKENQIEDITNTSLAAELEKKLISYDNYTGLYLSKRVSIDDINNINLIAFNLREYKNDNNLSYNKDNPYLDESGNKIGNSLLNIKKSDFNNYMHSKYNTKNDYDTGNLGINSINNSSTLDVCVTLFADENNYNFVSIGASCGNSYVINKIDKAEQIDNEIIIYDKAVNCITDVGTVCNKVSDDNTSSDSVLDCTSDTTQGTNNCPVEADAKSMAKYAIDNLSDKLYTFKHTFKKGTDGNYYWVSSEIEK